MVPPSASSASDSHAKPAHLESHIAHPSMPKPPEPHAPPPPTTGSVPQNWMHYACPLPISIRISAVSAPPGNPPQAPYPRLRRYPAPASSNPHRHASSLPFARPQSITSPELPGSTLRSSPPRPSSGPSPRHHHPTRTTSSSIDPKQRAPHKSQLTRTRTRRSDMKAPTRLYAITPHTHDPAPQDINISVCH